ncbi:MAG: acetyl-CoA carboxylase biotin carboxylase subunit [candidate division Zixibacteria bacterium SM23_81]|nr:MAG: acetyl-CoA carboxylase biotin carboxylase subunit [candidate division Zixibacteria bacterium SM23_81]
MFSKVLIANRGEIALRVIRACKELGISTVGVYSEADEASLHVRFADENVCIGPAPSSESYLNVSRIISAAELTNAEALHPGYGFLAENADFADICKDCGIVFIGPSAEMIRQMGDKSYARESMRKAGLPIIPGSEGVLKDVKHALQMAEKIGYPVMIKAAAGGGGRGMRIAAGEENLQRGFEMASSEAQSAFGSADLYLEKFMENPRHVEFQILGDKYGTIVHLGERDCSIQRRHQKLVEESPSPAMTAELRKKMGHDAVKGAKSIGYQGAGTVEFLLDRNGRYYFMEMNTRIQVEHPVTEAVVNIDLIKEQIRLAAGEPMGYTQKDVVQRGHAIECRINAEDPDKSFRPSPGEITSFHVPGGPGIRVDTHAYANYVIPPHYDSLLAKLIAHGKDRAEARLRMERALEEFVVEGPKTTIPFHQRVVADSRFQAGDFDTSFVEEMNAGSEG